MPQDAPRDARARAASDGAQRVGVVEHVEPWVGSGALGRDVDFAGAWFYAANGGQAQMLAVGIAAINGNKPVQVGADAPNPGNSPYTGISRMYLMKG